MILYLLRHAEAEPIVPAGAERKLTMKGKEQAKRVGKFCQQYQVIPSLVLTSPICRALETARHVIHELENIELIEAPWMACGMSPEDALKELQPYASFESLMLVGHEPDFSELIACLLGINNSACLNITKASLTAIKLKKMAPGAGMLEYFIPSYLTKN